MSNDDREALEAALRRELGSGPAATLLALLPPVNWGDVARQSELVPMRADIAELTADVAVLKADVGVLKADVGVLKIDVAVLKADVSGLKDDVSEIRTDVAGLKRDMVEVKVQLAKQVPTLITANVASMIGVAGLVLAAAKFV
ncbi:MAG: hypothetical protein ACRD2W_04745 [Acidimicrobiales bacterium]